MSTEQNDDDGPSFEELLAPMRKHRAAVSQHCESVKDEYSWVVAVGTKAGAINTIRCYWCTNRVASTCHHPSGQLSLTRAELVGTDVPGRCPGYSGPRNMDGETSNLDGWATWVIAFDIRQGVRDPSATE